MNPELQSPAVSSVSWGRIRIESRGSFKDVKLYPGGAREWDWNETGTRHDPGIQPADVQELLDRGATVVVLGTGMLGRLKVPPETLEALEEQGVNVHVSKTDDAVRTYNELRGEAPVGGLFHSTC